MGLMGAVKRWVSLLICGSIPGCQALIEHTDRSVYGIIEQRQRDALGATSNANIGPETGDIGSTAHIYDFVPNPLADPPKDEEDPPAVSADTGSPDNTAAIAPSDVPESTMHSPESSVENVEEDPEPLLPVDIFTAEERERATIFGLKDALHQAMQTGRDFQDAKEDLYLAALDLSLERHLWTPQLAASARTDYANYGQIRDFDQAMSAVYEFAVTQRLPYGGEVAARMVNSWMRDLTNHVTTGETGQMILSADIPLLRGAGPVAYESRFQAERDLIYAVRTFENFRRSYLVLVAAEFFNLQQLRAAITNTHQSYLLRFTDWEKADFINRMGRSQTVFDASRAKSSLRSAEADLVSAKEQYASALDRFKILLGMSVDVPLDVLSLEEDSDSVLVESLRSEVDESLCVQVAVKYRLDLLNTRDQVDDARRGVLIAKNRILPDLDATGSLTLDTNENEKNSFSYNLERATWRAGVEMRLDDRRTETTQYRASLVDFRRSERSYDEAADTVRADVRRALRRIEQQEDLKLIQALNVEENELRVAAARAQFELGRGSNQDVVDADNDLLDARNRLATAIAAYRNAILQFRQDTGTLRVHDDGSWDSADLFHAAPAVSAPLPKAPGP